MNDPRKEFLTSININKVSISTYPKVIFICGGDFDKKSTLSTSANHFKSARHYFHHHLSNTKPYSESFFMYAENAKDWNHFNLYSDLVTFEKDVAHMCKLIILFVESPGSLVELGVFSVLKEAASKIIVFVQKKYNNQDSFIKHGPVALLNKPEEDDVVFWYNWTLKNDGFLDDTEMEASKPQIMEAIDEKFKKPFKTFKTDEHKLWNESFKFLLVADLIYLFKALTRKEIINFVKYFGVELDKKTTDRILFCLERSELILSEPHGNEKFYLPDGHYSLFITYPPKKKRILDTARLGARISKYYRDNKDVRNSVITERE